MLQWCAQSGGQGGYIPRTLGAHAPSKREQHQQALVTCQLVSAMLREFPHPRVLPLPLLPPCGVPA